MADPNALYSYQGQEPRPLPHEIHYTEDWGGVNFRQGVESFTDEELTRAGYTGPIKIPSINVENQRLSWNSDKKKYIVEDIPFEELWERIREKRDYLLSESDWTMTSDAPSNLNYNEWRMYRQRLRDITTSFEDPREVVFPKSPLGIPNDQFDQPYVEEPTIQDRIANLEFYVEKLVKEILSVSENSETTQDG